MPNGSARVLVAAGYRPHHPWLRLPITDPDGTIRQYRGVTEAPGVYTVGQRFQHRRDSAMIDGARHDAQTGRRPPARPAPSGRPAHRAGSRSHEATTSSSSAVGSQAPRRPCCWPVPAPASPSSSAAAWAATPCPPTASCARGSSSCPAGAARPGGRGGHTADRAHRLPLPRRRPVQVSIRPSPGVDALYAPRRTVLDRILVDAAEEAGVDVLPETTVTSLLQDETGRVRGVVAQDATGSRSQIEAAMTVGADGIRSVVAQQVGSQVLRVLQGGVVRRAGPGGRGVRPVPVPDGRPLRHQPRGGGDDPDDSRKVRPVPLVHRQAHRRRPLERRGTAEQGQSAPPSPCTASTTRSTRCSTWPRSPVTTSAWSTRRRCAAATGTAASRSPAGRCRHRRLLARRIRQPVRPHGRRRAAT